MESITCPICGMTSYSPHDIAERYCGNCHIFYEDEPLPHQEIQPPQDEG
jgi:hypothetical protein